MGVAGIFWYLLNLYRIPKIVKSCEGFLVPFTSHGGAGAVVHFHIMILQLYESDTNSIRHLKRS